MLQITEEVFRENVNSGKPLVLLISAEWCAPCRVLKKLMTKIEDVYNDRLSFYSIDSDSTQELCADLHITAIPTLIFIVGSVDKSRLVGVRSENDIKDHIDELLV